MVVLALRRRSWTPVILILAAGTGSLLMTIVGKRLIGRTRPSLADAVPPFEHSPSFPSGHTLNAVVIAGIIAYLLVLRRHHQWSRITIVAVAFAFAVTIAATRVYLGHHWFTDVLAAFCLGLAWLALVITAHRLYLTVRKSREHRVARDPDAVAPPRGHESAESSHDTAPHRLPRRRRNPRRPQPAGLARGRRSSQERARANGHLLFLSTGRSPAEIPTMVTDLGFDGVISAGGGFIEHGGELVARSTMPARRWTSCHSCSARSGSSTRCRRTRPSIPAKDCSSA